MNQVLTKVRMIPSAEINSLADALASHEVALRQVIMVLNKLIDIHNQNLDDGK